MQRDFMNSLANRRGGSMQVTQTTTSGESSSSGGMSTGGSSVSGSISGGSTSSSGSTGAGGEWFTRETEQDGYVTMTHLPDARETGPNNRRDSRQIGHSSLAWPSREAQRGNYESTRIDNTSQERFREGIMDLHELIIPLWNTIPWGIL